MTQIQLFDSKIQKLVTIDSNAYIKARDEYCKRKNINKSGFASDFSVRQAVVLIVDNLNQ